MRYISNSFSLQMLESGSQIWISDISIDSIKEDLKNHNYKSIIGHNDILNVINNLLNLNLEYNRESIILNNGDIMYVAQLIGGRLPEGATELPNNFKIIFKKVVVFKENG